MCPLLDRIDINITVPRLEYKDVTATSAAESSEAVRRRVEKAREIGQQRLARFGLSCNAQMSHRHVKAACALNPQAQLLMRQAFDKFNLSARGYDRILKVARTIADLAGEEIIAGPAVAEAIHLRNVAKEHLLG